MSGVRIATTAAFEQVGMSVNRADDICGTNSTDFARTPLVQGVPVISSYSKQEAGHNAKTEVLTSGSETWVGAMVNMRAVGLLTADPWSAVGAAVDHMLFFHTHNWPLSLGDTPTSVLCSVQLTPSVLTPFYSTTLAKDNERSVC